MEMDDVTTVGRHSHLNALVLRFSQELPSGLENSPQKHSSKKPLPEPSEGALRALGDIHYTVLTPLFTEVALQANIFTMQISKSNSVYYVIVNKYSVQMLPIGQRSLRVKCSSKATPGISPKDGHVQQCGSEVDTPRAQCPGSCCPPDPILLFPYLPLPAIFPEINWGQSLACHWPIPICSLLKGRLDHPMEATVPYTHFSGHQGFQGALLLSSQEGKTAVSRDWRPGHLHSIYSSLSFCGALCVQSKYIIPPGAPSVAPHCLQGQVLASLASSGLVNAKSQALPFPANYEALGWGPVAGAFTSLSGDLLHTKVWAPVPWSVPYQTIEELPLHLSPVYFSELPPSCILSLPKQGHLSPSSQHPRLSCFFHTYYAVGFLFLYLCPLPQV